MAARHKIQRAKGGRVFYSGGESNVAKESKERKRGGRAYKHGGAVAKPRLDRGGVAKRASGGRTGSDKAPFSSAHLKGG